MPSYALNRVAIIRPGNSSADAGDHVADQPRPVFEAAAVGAGPIFRRQKFRQQIAVTLLEVDEIDADLCGQARGGDVLVFDPLQLVVARAAEKTRRPRGRSLCRLSADREWGRASRASSGDSRSGRSASVAGRRRSPRRSPKASRCDWRQREIISSMADAEPVMQPELPRIGTPLVADGGGLAPDQFRPAAAEADVAAECQLVGPAVESCRRSPPSVEWRGGCRSVSFRSAPVETAHRIVRTARAQLPSGPPRRRGRPAF